MSNVEVVELSGAEWIEMLDADCLGSLGMNYEEFYVRVKQGEIEPYSHDNPLHEEMASIAMLIDFGDQYG